MLPFVCVVDRLRRRGARAPVRPAAHAARRRLEVLDDAVPEIATAFGYPGQNARWTDYSPAAIDARADYLKESVSRLSAIDRASLDANDQLNYDLYRDLLDTAVAGLEFHNDAMPIRGVIPHNLLMPINQLEGIAQDIPRTIALMPAVTREDYENIVSRLQGVGAARRSDDRADGAGTRGRPDAAEDHDARRAGSGRGADRRRTIR